MVLYVSLKNSEHRFCLIYPRVAINSICAVFMPQNLKKAGIAFTVHDKSNSAGSFWKPECGIDYFSTATKPMLHADNAGMVTVLRSQVSSSGGQPGVCQ